MSKILLLRRNRVSIVKVETWKKVSGRYFCHEIPFRLKNTISDQLFHIVFFIRILAMVNHDQPQQGCQEIPCKTLTNYLKYRGNLDYPLS